MRHITTNLTPRFFGALLGALLALYAFITGFGLVDHGIGELISVPLYSALEIGAALFCLAAAVFRREHRAAWAAIGLGIASFAAGDIYFSFVLIHQDPVPYPSLADLGYIGLYPLVYLGVGLLLRDRTLQANRSFWLDGTI